MFSARNTATSSVLFTLLSNHPLPATLRLPFVPPQIEINHALADLRYLGYHNASGEDIISVKSSDGSLEGSAFTAVQLAWPTGADTRPPTLSVLPLMIQMPEDESIVLGSVNVRFGDGRSLVSARARCSAGVLTIGVGTDRGVEDVVVDEGLTEGSMIGLRGLPQDIEKVLSTMTFVPPRDWSARGNGAITLTVEVEPTGAREVRSACRE